LTSASVRTVVEPADWDATSQGFPATEHPRTAPAAMSNRRRVAARHRLHALMTVGDVAGAGAAALLVASTEPWLAARTSAADRYGFALVTSCVIVAVLAVKGSYGGTRRRVAPRVADDLGGLLFGLVVSGVCLLALGTVGHLRAILPPVEIGLALLTSAFVIPAFREAALVFAARNPANVARLVIVGNGYVARFLLARLDRSALVEVVGVVDDAAVDGYRHLGTIEDLPAVCHDKRVDRVIVAFSGRHPGRSAEVLQDLRGVVDVDIVVRYFELANWESHLSDVTGLSLISIGHSAGPVAAATKRVLDVAVATVGLALSGPVLLAAALAIRVESGGPVLFRQTRIGRGRRQFRIVKLRTMLSAPEGRTPSTNTHVPLSECVHGPEPGNGHGPARETGSRSSLVPRVPGNGLAALGIDEVRVRTPLDTTPDPELITRIGKLLRRTGIDELPQLFNVLLGHMSLVGPRPFIPEECTGIRGTVERRFDVKPGMTGLWQVCGQHELAFDELCRLDVQYATSWSLRGDLRILARTPGRLVRGSAPDR
jgi:lipopolysaccharide/colanic/teichoic acid biosynthesis glycosyltransferase